VTNIVQERCCRCYYLELKITLLGLALSAQGYGYKARYEENDLQMTRAMLDAGADPNLCWQKREAGQWVDVHPLERALSNKRFDEHGREDYLIGNEELFLLLSFGSIPPSEIVARELVLRNVLSPPDCWLRRFGVLHVVSKVVEQWILRFLIVVRTCQPKMHKDVVALILRRLARC